MCSRTHTDYSQNGFVNPGELRKLSVRCRSFAGAFGTLFNPRVALELAGPDAPPTLSARTCSHRRSSAVVDRGDESPDGRSAARHARIARSSA